MTDPTDRPWPRRVAVLTESMTIAGRSGAGEYLSQTAQTLRTLGARVDLLCLSGISPTMRRMALVAPYAAAFDNVHLAGARLIGTRMYAINPRNWLRGLRGARPAAAPDGSVRGAPEDALIWRLPPPRADAIEWARRRLRAMQPDLVIANYFNAAEALDAAPPDTPTAVLVHDVITLRARSLAAAGAAPDFAPDMPARETAAFAHADLCLTIKSVEARHIAALPGCAAAVLPHALDMPPVNLTAPRPPVALFVGSVNPPNVDGLRWLLDDVWPAVVAARPKARLRVVGRVATRHAGPWPAGAAAVGVVENLADEYAQAAVALTPLRFGSGLKIKLVEGLAHGAPAVATPVGAEGVEDAPAAALRVAADAPGFAAAILETLAAPDPVAARVAARAYAEERFSREAAASRLRAALAPLRPVAA